MVEISAAPVMYSDANQLRIWAWENRSGQMLTLGCTLLGPQNFRKTHAMIWLVSSSSTPKITSCPDNMSKCASAGFQVDKSKTEKQSLQHTFFSLVNGAERPSSRVNKIRLLR